MGRNQHRQASQPPPLSAAITRRGGVGASSDDSDMAGGGAVRLVALLGVGLTAAALLLPSGETPVTIPADTLQPATDAAARDATAVDRTDVGAGARPTSPPLATGSSAASVTGDDLGAVDRKAATQTTPHRVSTPRAEPRSGAKDKPRPRSKRASTRTPRSAQATQPTRRQPAPAAAPPPAPAPRPAPAPTQRPKTKPKRSGGPSAEFGL